MLAEVSLSPARKKSAIARIRAAKQPKAEARRIVDQARKDTLAGLVDREAVDFSDVQEIRVRLYRRDGGIWPPHTDLLSRMDRMIAAGEISPETFATMAEAALAMRPAGLSAQYAREVWTE